LLFSLFSTELSAGIIVFPQKPLVSATLPSLFPAVFCCYRAVFVLRPRNPKFAPAKPMPRSFFLALLFEHMIAKKSSAEAAPISS
jgi:hypothetical protein